jgi:hypothetical protein
MAKSTKDYKYLQCIRGIKLKIDSSILSLVWVKSNAFLVLFFFPQLKSLFWNNRVREWSEILHTSYWFWPTSNCTQISGNYVQPNHVKLPQWSPFKETTIYTLQSLSDTHDCLIKLWVKWINLHQCVKNMDKWNRI